MTPMNSILPILLIIAMLATAVVLFAGVISFAFNSKVNSRYATQLMSLRVIFQGVAIALFGLIVLLNVT